MPQLIANLIAIPWFRRLSSLMRIRMEGIVIKITALVITIFLVLGIIGVSVWLLFVRAMKGWNE
jgi:hypothetical protein